MKQQVGKKQTSTSNDGPDCSVCFIVHVLPTHEHCDLLAKAGEVLAGELKGGEVR